MPIGQEKSVRESEWEGESKRVKGKDRQNVEEENLPCAGIHLPVSFPLRNISDCSRHDEGSAYWPDNVYG